MNRRSSPPGPRGSSPVARRLVSVAAAAAITISMACGGATPPPAEPSLPPLGELWDLVPPEAHLVVTARPRVLAAMPAIRRVADVIVPADYLDAFARRTGVEPTEVERAVFAEFDEGFLLLVQGPWRAEDVVRAQALRMNTVSLSSAHPFFRRGGYLGTQYRELIALREHVVLISAAPASVLAEVLARAQRGRWSEGRGGALSPPDVASLRDAYGGHPLALFVPHPIDLPSGLGASVLLSRHRALAVAVRPQGPDELRFTIAIPGEFPEGAVANFRTWVDSVAHTDLGAALGIGEAVRTLRVQVDGSEAVLALSIPASALAMGLRILFVAELGDLFGTEAANDGG